MNVMLKRFVRASQIPAFHSPHIPPRSKPEWRESGEALNASYRKECGFVSRSAFGLAAGSRNFKGLPACAPAAAHRAALLCLRLRRAVLFATFLLLMALTLSATAGVREVGAIGLTVNDLGRVLPFYTNTLAFELVAISEVSSKDQDDLLDLKNAKLSVATLKLGDERILLTEHRSKKGRLIPQDSRSFDRWFQHIAIVVSDMDKAYARLLAHKVTHVSTAPQTLPDWNKDAGGIKAFYFRDPEDHVLELIWFPAEKADPRWQKHAGSETGAPLFLGIDHTAIVVSDTDKSLAFYRDQLGFRVAGGAHNYGTEQEHLNQVFGARLRITALKAERGPGIEFLEYIAPPGGRDLPADAKANDLVFWNTHLVVDDVAKLSEKLHERGAAFVSRPGNARSHIVRDPDGHALQLDNASATSAASARR
jgi:catechol 2,3-dioxygenase-like lactoylglutathione lyase family enzyme